MPQNYWDVSFDSAQEMDRFAANLDEASNGLISANQRLSSVLESNRMLGPHREQILQYIGDVDAIAAKCSSDTQSLAEKLRNTSSTIKELCEREMGLEARAGNNQGN